jgi:hypothetical protein
MAHAGVRVKVFAYETVFQFGHFAFLFVNAEVIVEQGYSGAVVSPILKAFESF